MHLLTTSQRQVKQGIDAVIVDSVLAIRKGLAMGEEEALTRRKSQVAEGEGGMAANIHSLKLTESSA